MPEQNLLKSGLGHTSTFDEEDHPSEALTFADRASDFITNLYGSWTAFWAQGALLTVWAIINTFVVLHLPHFDPYPFTFLNLFLSSEAAFSTTFVLMSQNRAARRDRALLEMVTQSSLRTEAALQEIEVVLTQLVADTDQQKVFTQNRMIMQQNVEILKQIGARRG